MVLPQSNESKIIDIKISVFVAKHSSVASVDHLSTLLRSSSSTDGQFEKLRLHKTKCTAIIKKVVSPTILESLVEDIGSSKYSLIVDESTDVSQTKWMRVCVRFFDVKNLRVITQFLGIFLVEEATAEHLFNSMKLFLKKVGLNIQNIIAIGTDGAKNLCGKNKSLFTLLKNENPQLILVKCTCHSLHLCCSKASNEIPKNADFLIKEVYNYFSHSPLRSLKYKRAFDLINAGIDGNSFRKLVQISGTRWLSYGSAIKRILEQWVELKYHFSSISMAENDRTAQNIYDELCDEKNRLFLVFISPIVNEMNSLNLEFQSDNMDAGSMHEKMFSTLLLFSSKIVKPSVLNNNQNIEKKLDSLSIAIESSNSFLPLDVIDFGSDFETEISTVDMNEEEVRILKENCFVYLKKILKEMINRLPENMNVFKVFSQFSILKCGNSLSQPKFSIIHDALKIFMDPEVALGVYESQWGKLAFVNWKDYFNDEIPTNLLDFWPKVYDYHDAAGTYHFRELSLAVLNMLVIPTSNACVERVFSIMNYTKTRLRNKIQYDLLDALLRIINYMNVNKLCCNSFNPTDKMLNKFNSNVMYETQDNHIDADENDVYNFIDFFN